MSINLKKWLLGLGLNLMVLAGTASAQVGAFNPLTEPSDFQFFVQPDLSNYGSGVRANTGWFGGIEYLLWATTAPKRTEIGVADGARTVYNGNYGYFTQTNTADTGFIRAALESGTRFEFGFMDDDDRGWLFSAYRLNNSTSLLTQTNSSMVFTEPSYALYDNRINAATGDSAVEVVGFAPILHGWVDNYGPATGGTYPTTGVPVHNQPDGIADDVDRDNTYGPYGREIPAVVANVTQPLNHIPSTEANGTPLGAYTPIDYGDMVPLPILFSSMNVKYRTTNYSLEANRQWRVAEGRFGGNFDVFAGPRYVSFTDQFMVDAVGGILADSYWNAQSNNRIVGGQVGFRLNKKSGRLTLTTEGRMFSGAALQTVNLNGSIGSKLNQTIQNPAYTVGTNTLPNITDQNSTVATPAPTQGGTTITQTFTNQQANNPGGGTQAVRLNQPVNMNRTSFTSQKNFVTFSPLGELRAKAQYQVFDSVSLNAGWTGTWIGGVMRSNNMINYTLPEMAVSGEQRTQGVFINGATFGVEWNR